MILKSILAVSLGAALGALLRWQLSIWLNASFPSIPPGTLLSNLIGGYVVGIAIAVFATSTLPLEWRLFVITGFCGGLTTFSTCCSRGARCGRWLPRASISWDR